MKKTIKVFAAIFLVLILVVIYFSCTIWHYYGGRSGLIIDAKTGKPIQGAAVVGVYYIVHGTVGGQVDEYVDAQETTTDENGRFILPGKFVWAPRLPSLGNPISHFSKQPRLHIFEPNYAAAFVWKVESDHGNIPEFRLSHLETDDEKKWNAAGVVVYERAAVAAKFPNFLNLVNAELRKHGMTGITLWK